MWTKQKLRPVEPEVVKAMTQSGEPAYIYGNQKPDRKACELHFDALKRMLERTEGSDYLS